MREREPAKGWAQVERFGKMLPSKPARAKLTYHMLNNLAKFVVERHCNYVSSRADPESLEPVEEICRDFGLAFDPRPVSDHIFYILAIAVLCLVK